MKIKGWAQKGGFITKIGIYAATLLLDSFVLWVALTWSGLWRSIGLIHPFPDFSFVEILCVLLVIDVLVNRIRRKR